ncbi:FixH family protein [Ghiorsea bivora]|uniref:FixH family protein n=1 Tax=Ghiorsea bivora TaxID=1485545 RepID=UPI000571C273|nr:FixH family protein [Ghiorsea bivora]
MNKPNKKNKAFRSPYVWSVLALFAIVFTVNFGFVTAALDTSPGLVTEKYYKYGLQQNKFDRQYRTQAERGWNVDLQIDDAIQANQPSIITLVVTDQYAQPISHGHAELRAYRPSDAKADVLLNLKETDKEGVYQAELTLLTPGIWDMNLLFAKDEDKHMLNKRVVIKGKSNEEPTTLEKIVNFITL